LGGGTGENWHHLKIPAINENDEPLWEFKHSIDDLHRMKAANPFNFAGQYLQNPTPKEGGIIKSEWFERYRVPPSEKLRVIQSWDTAYKPKIQNDPSVCTTWLQTSNNKYYLLDCHVMRGEYPDVKRAVESKYDQFKPQAVLIEDKASGQSLIQEFRHTRIPVIAVLPESDKITRLNSVSTMFEARQVYLPENAAWLADYEHELLSFPLAAHDDQADSTSQALEWLRSKSTNSTPLVGTTRKF
jgi:predicted phage terminase large subunit-like protein